MKDSREREQELLKKISEAVREGSTDEESKTEPGSSYFIAGGDIFNVTLNFDRGRAAQETPEVPWGAVANPAVRKPEAPLTDVQRYCTRRWIYDKCASFGNRLLFVDYCELQFGTSTLSQLTDDELVDVMEWVDRYQG
ncbi:hypothetical protein [uncultured Tateyamaria sp.]|uniref:hypothetical protein n=1 Tax=uncultured Tateyamaria sp. TaxID=455651 RepID=UPI0026271BC2|nr:hypothetical protein [uncultured Tateyamaria sp.]